jgi:hypothetical protein
MAPFVDAWMEPLLQRLRRQQWVAGVADRPVAAGGAQRPLVVFWLAEDVLLWPTDFDGLCDEVQRMYPKAQLLLAAERPSRDVARAAVALQMPIAFREELYDYLTIHYEVPTPHTYLRVIE